MSNPECEQPSHQFRRHSSFVILSSFVIRHSSFLLKPLTSGEDRFMATVRISGNWRNPSKKEWAGAPRINKKGQIERSLDIPEAAYQALERDIAKGNIEGTVYLEDGSRFDWFVDR
jgi:hypothetical protein